MVSFFKAHTLYSIYIIILMFLTYGIWVTSGSKYFFNIALYFTSLTFFYFSISYLIKRKSINIALQFKSRALKIEYLLIFSIILIISHYVYLGYIPIIRAIGLESAEEIAWVRTNITRNNNAFFNYSSSFLIRAILPFLLLYLNLKGKNKLFYIFIFVSSFYAFSLMQKSYIVTLLLPSLIYSIYSKKISHSITNILILISFILGISTISNPKLNIEEKKTENTSLEKSDSRKKPSKIARIFLGLRKRVLVVPGKMVSNWFDHVPSTLPFLGIDGYRIIAKIRGKKHIGYGKALYPYISKKYYNRGLTGTVNVASFMYEYAYFGKIGLILSGFLLSSLLVLCELIFNHNFILKLAINTYPILILSSTALTTTLLSGGWIFLILLFVIYKSDLRINTLKPTNNV